jgi:hypothetical protein
VYGHNVTSRSIAAISPMPSKFGGNSMKRSIGTGCPPVTLWRTASSSARDF